MFQYMNNKGNIWSIARDKTNYETDIVGLILIQHGDGSLDFMCD